MATDAARLTVNEAFDEGVEILYALTGEKKDGFYPTAELWAESAGAAIAEDEVETLGAEMLGDACETRSREESDFAGHRVTEWDAGEWNDELEIDQAPARPLLVVDLGDYRVVVRDCSR